MVQCTQYSVFEAPLPAGDRHSLRKKNSFLVSSGMLLSGGFSSARVCRRGVKARVPHCRPIAPAVLRSACCPLFHRLERAYSVDSPPQPSSSLQLRCTVYCIVQSHGTELPHATRAWSAPSFLPCLTIPSPHLAAQHVLLTVYCVYQASSKKCENSFGDWPEALASLPSYRSARINPSRDDLASTLPRITTARCNDQAKAYPHLACLSRYTRIVVVCRRTFSPIQPALPPTLMPRTSLGPFRFGSFPRNVEDRSHTPERSIPCKDERCWIAPPLAMAEKRSHEIAPLATHG
jgi:hypothetical protein